MGWAISGAPACAPRVASDPLPVNPREADVYRTVLRDALGNLRTPASIVIIADSTERFDRGHPSRVGDAAEEWRLWRERLREVRDFPLERFPELPADLATNYRVRNERSSSLRGRLRVMGDREDYRFASEVRLDSVLTGDNSSFYGSRPYERILVTFSEVGFSTDGTWAFVYMGLHCGGRCGSGTLILLRRGVGDWERVNAVPLWIS